MRRYLMVTVLVAGILALLAVSYLFRLEVISTSEAGELSVKYRWGAPYEVRQDINLDGRNDIVSIVTAPIGRYSPHTVAVVETFYDLNRDGAFEAHAVFQSSTEGVESLTIDRDSDGTRETELWGEEATRENERITKEIREKIRR